MTANCMRGSSVNVFLASHSSSYTKMLIFMWKKILSVFLFIFFYSCLSLATKCTMASFRMHLRAHGVVAKVFSALHDAYTHAVRLFALK